MDQSNIQSNLINTYNYFFNTPLGLTITIIVIILCLIMLTSLGENNVSNNISSEGTSRSAFSIIFSIILVILVIFILFKAYDYFIMEKGITDVINQVSNIMNPSAENTPQSAGEVEYKPSPVREIKFKKQVFNIPGNYYNYKDAKAMCKAYGSELATYKQLEDAYKNNAEWCNYGWSSGQMAFFPTQQQTFDELQKIKGHEHDCGRPGINGGYIPDANTKFGVNCYGYKPRMTDVEEELMKTMPRYPQTKEELEFEKKVARLKGKLDKIIVSPFNPTTWSQI